jgi:hypothetical protein
MLKVKSSRWALVLRPKTSQTLFSPHDEHWSSCPRPVKLCSVLMMSTCPPAQDQSNFVLSSWWALVLRPKTSQTLFCPHDEHWSSGPRPVKLCLVLMMSTGPLAQDQSNFVLSSGPRPVKLCLVLMMSTCPPAQDQ